MAVAWKHVRRDRTNQSHAQMHAKSTSSAGPLDVFASDATPITHRHTGHSGMCTLGPETEPELQWGNMQAKENNTHQAALDGQMHQWQMDQFYPLFLRVCTAIPGVLFILQPAWDAPIRV